MWSVTLFLLAIAVSLDSFGVGVTYGLRNIRIPFKSVVVIALCSGTVMFISMNVGSALATLLSVEVANIIGAVILIGLGLWTLYHGKQETRDESVAGVSHNKIDPVSKQVWAIEIKRLGIVIQILKKPVMADMDSSGTITPGEAVLLGFALSLDAFGAGLGAAMIGLSVWTAPTVIALMGAAFLLLGLRVGFHFRQIMWLKHLYFVPGVVLILIGCSRFWW